MSTDVRTATNTTIIDPIVPINVWGEHSFFLEMKPRGDFASLFIDCPPINESSSESPKSKRLVDNEFVRIGSNSLEVVEDLNINQASSGQSSENKTKYVASFSDIVLVPNSVCALSWADRRNRLFMCKVCAKNDEGLPFCRKSFRSFEEEIRLRTPIKECVNEMSESGTLKILCRQCRSQLYSHYNGECEFGVLPDDDWLDTSPSMEFFCGQACGGGHGLDHHCHSTSNEGILSISTTGVAQSASNWLPNAKKIVFTHSYLMLLENDSLKLTIKRHDESGRLLTCAECDSQIGMTLRTNKSIYRLHVGAVEVFCQEELVSISSDYIFLRFQSLERYYAWMFLYKSESQSSMKLLIRTYQQRPFILVWLLEPYVIMANGVLKRQSSNDKIIGNEENRMSTNDAESPTEPEHQSHPALKILYKIYDEESAASDPRANGGDSSIGIADLPYNCSLQLAEILLRSTHSLPPSLRAVGQLYVGYFRLDENN